MLGILQHIQSTENEDVRGSSHKGCNNGNDSPHYQAGGIFL